MFIQSILTFKIPICYSAISLSQSNFQSILPTLIFFLKSFFFLLFLGYENGDGSKMNPLQQLFVLFCLTAQSYILADRPAQSFLREPPDQTAKVGDHVTLPCQVTNKKGTLQWTRDGFGLGVERNLTGFDRYRMSGIDEEGKKIFK